MYEEKNKTYTLIIYSGPKDRIKKISLSKNLLRAVYIFLVIAVASVAILVSNLYITRQKLNEKIAEIERIEYKINYKEVELVNLEKKTTEIQSKTKLLENYLKEVQELDKLVRNITGQGGYDGEVTIYDNGLNADLEILADPDEIFYYTNAQNEELEDINLLLDNLLSKAPELAASLQSDKKDMEDYIYVMEHTPSIWPTWGRITSTFKERRWGHLHMGLDIANAVGIPVSSSASGVVIFTGWQSGYGKKVVIYHSDEYTTVYAHLNDIYVNVGEKVTQGQVIGAMGSTGRSTGPHLHYEVYVNGVPQNPKGFLP